MPEHVRCNLCGADDTRLVYSLRDYRLRIDDRLWNLVQCRHCSLGYLDPRPTAAEIGMYYPESYFGHRAGMGRRYALQAAYVPGTGGNLLDIGAARGDFLAVMRDRGWNVTGIEPSTSDNPHGLTIHRQRFPEDCELASESFDVITAWAVFEHLHDPAAAFARVTQLLRPGGRFILQVPNLRSISARHTRLEDIPRHLYFFSPRTLREYARRSGLSLRTIHHTTSMYGGSGRGVLGRLLVQASGGDTDAFFRFYRMTRASRFRQSPVLAAAWTAAGAFERVVMPDWLIRASRVSGQVVAVIDKSIAAPATPTT
jgi:2-polyprenyl-3-methyl-5-hydroxy-6-metoxy-1,4-benzoquinol methylase